MGGQKPFPKSLYLAKKLRERQGEGWEVVAAMVSSMSWVKLPTKPNSLEGKCSDEDLCSPDLLGTATSAALTTPAVLSLAILEESGPVPRLQLPQAARGENLSSLGFSPHQSIWQQPATEYQTPHTGEGGEGTCATPQLCHPHLLVFSQPLPSGMLTCQQDKLTTVAC